MTSKLVAGRPKPRANYPHLRQAGDFVFLSGTTSRRPDNSIAGAEVDEVGTARLDIEAQTEAVIENMRELLASVGAGLEDLCEVTCYLVNINDFGGFNRAYNRYFKAETGPARATVAVHQLAHPHFLVEIKGVAWKPIEQNE